MSAALFYYEELIVRVKNCQFVLFVLWLTYNNSMKLKLLEWEDAEWTDLQWAIE